MLTGVLWWSLCILFIRTAGANPSPLMISFYFVQLIPTCVTWWSLCMLFVVVCTNNWCSPESCNDLSSTTRDAQGNRTGWWWCNGCSLPTLVRVITSHFLSCTAHLDKHKDKHIVPPAIVISIIKIISVTVLVITSRVHMLLLSSCSKLVLLYSLYLYCCSIWCAYTKPFSRCKAHWWLCGLKHLSGMKCPVMIQRSWVQTPIRSNLELHSPSVYVRCPPKLSFHIKNLKWFGVECSVLITLLITYPLLKCQPMNPHLDLSRCPLLHKSLQPPPWCQPL